MPTTTRAQHPSESHHATNRRSSAGRCLGVAALAAIAGLFCSCSTTTKPQAPIDVEDSGLALLPTMSEPTPSEYPGLHNAVAFHDRFVSGSAPGGDAGFDTLAAMGVKTIISVDGAVPEVDKAAARGIRYIHLPIGYNGFNEERRFQLVRATRDAMAVGPVYIHCHHGKHRSAAAAAAIAASLGWMTPQAGVERMKVSGTAPNYTGLFRCAAASAVLATTDIDAVPPEFPSVWRPSGFVRTMLETDETFDHLSAIEKAGWNTPANHPDLVPAAEAARLADLFRNSLNANSSKHSAAGFDSMLEGAHASAQKLEALLSTNNPNPAALTAQFKLVAASCKDCHAKHRD